MRITCFYTCLSLNLLCNRLVSICGGGVVVVAALGPVSVLVVDARWRLSDNGQTVVGSAIPYIRKTSLTIDSCVLSQQR